MPADPDRLQAVFLEAVAIDDVAERAALLDRLCNGDAELRRRVEDLLAAHHAPDSLLDNAPVPSPGEATTHLIPEATIGAFIANRFKLLEQIGEGGMGLVFMAEQRAPVRRLVAIKLIKAGMDSKVVMARFAAERQALAMMDHPSIARVFDGGITDRGHPWFAMELVRGLPLNEYCDQRRMPINERLALFMEICSAAQHAHQKGIIHRDLKPSNVLITEVDGRPVPKVIDFGLAKALGGAALTEHTLHTAYGAAAGTPLYMAPEQVAVSALDVDTRADVYALGVMLYELLTGTTPLQRERLKEAAWDEVRRVIREEEPPLPSLRISKSNALASLAATRHVEPAKLSGLIKGDLDWIVLKALEKDRNRRYDSAASFAADVQRHMSDEPVIAAPPSLSYRTRKFIRKHRGPVIAAGLLLTVLTASTVIIAGMYAVTNTALSDAEVARTREATQSDAAEEARRKAVLQSYVNGIAAAQNAMEGNNWPEARLRLNGCPPECRGWEWEMLMARASAPMFGLIQSASNCKLAGNGKHLLIRDWSDKFSLVDMETRQTVGTYQGKRLPPQPDKTYWVPDAAVADGGRVAIQVERSIELWNLVGQKVVIESDLEYLEDGSDSLHFSPQSKYLIADYNNAIRIFDGADGRAVGKIAFNRKRNAVAFSPDDRFILARTQPRVATVFSPNGEKRKEFRIPDATTEIGCVCFAPDCQRVAIGTYNSKVFVFDSKSGKILSSLDIGLREVEHLSFHADGRHLLAACFNSGPLLTTVWDVDAEARVAAIRRAITSPRFSNDGERILGLDDGSQWKWRRGDAPDAFTPPIHNASVVAYSNDGSFVLSLDDGVVSIWDTAIRSRQPAVQLVDLDEPSLERSAPLGPITYPLEEWEMAGREAAQVLIESPDEVDFTQTSVAATDGSWRAEAVNGVCMLVDEKTGARIALNSHDGAVNAMVGTIQNQRLITGGADGSVRIWRTSDGTEVATFRYSSPVTGMTLSSDGTRLILTFVDGRLEVWDARSAEQRDEADRALAEEWKAANAVVDAKLGKERPWSEIARELLSDRTIPATRRSAAVEQLCKRIEMETSEINDLFNELRTALGIKQVVEEAFKEKNLTPVQSKYADELMADWVQTDEEVQDFCNAIAEDPLARAPAIASAIEQMEEAYRKKPADGFRSTIAALEYRAGNYQRNIELMSHETTGNREESKVENWYAHSHYSAFHAMAEHRLGHSREARERLRTSLRYWFPGDLYSELQREAAMLIEPRAIDVTPPQPTALWLAADAIDASDRPLLDSKLGAEVRLKGAVFRVSPISSGKNANIVLYPAANGVSLFIKFKPGSGLSWDFAKSLDGQEIVVTGVVAKPPTRISAWMQPRLQIIVESADQIKVLGPSSTPRWWEEADGPRSVKGSSPLPADS